MKKILLLMFVVCASLTVNAQVYVGGSIGFWHNDDADLTTFTISPEIGYNISDKWAIGGELSFKQFNYDGYKINTFTIAPYARYSYFKSGMVRLFLDGGFGYSNIKPDEGDSENGFEIGIKPGIALDLTNKISLVSKFGFLGYRDEYIHNIDGNLNVTQLTTTNGFGLGILGNDLSLGIQIKF